MRIVPFHQVDPIDWDALCDSSSQAWLFHRSAWIEIENRYFFPDNHSFGLYEGKRLLAIQPLYKAFLGMGSWSETLLHSGVHRHTGLALADGLDDGTINAARSTSIRRIEKIAGTIDADRVQLNTQNLAPENSSLRRREIPFWVSDYGYLLGLGIGPGGIAPAPGIATCCADQIVELNQNEEKLFSRLDESGRRAVRKAQTAQLECCEGTNEPICEYYAIAELSAKRTGETLAPRSYYEDIWKQFHVGGYCHVLFACAGEKKAAGLFLLVYKEAAHFLGGVSDPEYLSVRVNDFLHWSAIIWAKRRGLRHYRIGPIFPEVPDDWAVARVSRFKGKFGGRPVSVIQGSYFRHPEKYLEIGQAHLAALVAACRKD